MWRQASRPAVTGGRFRAGSTLHTTPERPRLSRRGLAVAALAAAACNPFSSGEPGGEWPSPVATASDSSRAAQAREEYLAAGYDARRNFVTPYASTGDYLRYGITVRIRPGPRIRLDSLGLPMVLYDTTYYYNPVTMAQFGLAAHGRWLAGRSAEDSTEFLRASEFLLTMVSGDGALRYPFPFTYYFSGTVAPAGWVSGMAQGQALSLFARAYKATGDERYLEAGRRTLEFLTVPIDRGGPASTLYALDPSLVGFTIYEEYPASPPAYTLNGFLFTVVGVYDWSATDPEPPQRLRARRMFEEAIATVEGMLPLYDIGGFTAYDLAFLTYGIPSHVVTRYHAVHIYLLHALHSVWPSPVLRDFECRWLDDVQGAGTCDASH